LNRPQITAIPIRVVSAQPPQPQVLQRLVQQQPQPPPPAQPQQQQQVVPLSESTLKMIQNLGPLLQLQIQPILQPQQSGQQPVLQPRIIRLVNHIPAQQQQQSQQQRLPQQVTISLHK
jgi:hypothetical protein